MALGAIQDFVQAYVENLSEVLGLDVTVLDENGVRIGGTGAYQAFIGQLAPQGSFFERVLKTGNPGIILDTKKNASECAKCKFVTQCKELATIGFPVFKAHRPVGVIGLIGFSQQQKEIIMHQADKLVQYLQHTSILLENKLLLAEMGERYAPATQAACEVQEKETIHQQREGFDQIVGSHFLIQKAINQAKKVVNSPSTVLLRGASGTGKERFARAIHQESMRRNQPFVVVNCAAIPETLLESELFGYMPGAFTGAKRDGQAGKFEQANGGTLFLDEIGDLPLALQPKLLRVLQEREVQRLGSHVSIPLDVRVIAATHRPLEQKVREGTFREDLYYRINVIPIQLPSLAERKEDLPLLLETFLGKYNERLGKHIKGFDPDVMHVLMNYSWPGNVRELENVVEYMVNMAERVILSVHDLPPHMSSHKQQAFSSFAQDERGDHIDRFWPRACGKKRHWMICCNE